MKKHSGQRRTRRRTKRKLPRNTSRQAPQQPKPSHEEPIFLTTAWMAPPSQEDDDCPWCRAQRELGFRDGIAVSPTQYAAYEARVDEIVRNEGMPEGAVSMTGEQFARRHEWIRARLQTEGRETDPDRIPDHELPAFFERVYELSCMYDQIN